MVMLLVEIVKGYEGKRRGEALLERQLVGGELKIWGVLEWNGIGRILPFD